MLSDLVPAGHRQQELFTREPDERMIKLAGVMDWVNARHGRDRLRLASAGYDPSWHHKQEWMSPGTRPNGAIFCR
jgi:DNA polymerase V